MTLLTRKGTIKMGELKIYKSVSADYADREEGENNEYKRKETRTA